MLFFSSSLFVCIEVLLLSLDLLYFPYMSSDLFICRGGDMGWLGHSKCENVWCVCVRFFFADNCLYTRFVDWWFGFGCLVVVVVLIILHNRLGLWM